MPARERWSRAGTHSVQFDYTPMSPRMGEVPIVSYSRGVETVIRSKLTAIEAWAPNPYSTQQVWTYRLDYTHSADTGRNLLHTVQVCDQGGVCSWAKTFDYTTANAGYEDHVAPGGPEFDDVALSRDSDAYYIGYQGVANADGLPATDVRLMLFDTNGDGVDECLYRSVATKLQPIAAQDDYDTSLYVVRYPGTIRLRSSAPGEPLRDVQDVSSTFEPSSAEEWSGCSSGTEAHPRSIHQLRFWSGTTLFKSVISARYVAARSAHA